jgi:1-phosphofructokinase
VGQHTPRATVFAPSPLLTVTVEASPDGGAEVHLHAGSQAVWIARMLVTLGLEVWLCGPFGGETGPVIAGLIERERINLRVVEVEENNASYVHDRRSGERVEVATVPPPPLPRHELDELYNVTLIEGLDSDVVVLGGPDDDGVLAPDTYRRLAADLVTKSIPVVVDLSGEYLEEAVSGGVTVAKVSHEDLVKDGRAASDDPSDLIAVMQKLASAGAKNVVVSRADEPALALLKGELLELELPSFHRADHRGAGDSMTAGIAAGIARGTDVEAALRLGAAAGALNATRRGLATGEAELIERLAERVTTRRTDDGKVQ